MTDDQHGDQHGGGTPPSGGRWDPLPQGDYDDGATAFVKLPEGGVDALLASADSPLAAPGHGYVPPQITVAPATTAGTDPAATGTWAMPAAPVDGTQWHAPDAGQEPASPHGQSYGEYAQQDPYGGAAPYDAGAGQGDRFAYRPQATGQWDFSEAAAGTGAGTAESAAPEPGTSGTAPGQDVTGQWSIPVAGGDLPDESGEFTQSSLAEQWGGTAPATLPGGAPAPWATQSAGQPWGDRAVTPAPGTGERPAEAAPPATPGNVDDAASAGEYRSHDFRGPDPQEHDGFQEHDGHREHGEYQEHGEFQRPDDPQGAGEAAEGPAEGPARTADGPGPEPVREPAEAPATAPAPEAPEGERPPVSGPERDLLPGDGAEAGREADPARAPEAARAPETEAPQPPRESADVRPPGHAAVPDAAPEARPGDDDRPHPTDEDADPTAPAAGAGATDAAEPGPGGQQGPSGPSGPNEEHPLASYVLRVNGADRPVTDAWIGESLLYVLRERLGLAGAKDGCSQGECGACNVQVDGRLVASCLVPAVTAAGSEVRTVEGLAADGRPSDVQRALARRGAVQCGFCVPGMAMTVHNLLEGNPAPTELEARQALCGNLCRCSGYRGVLEAVKEVVAEREAHGAEAPETDAEEPRIPHQAGPGAGGVSPTAFEPHDQPYGDQPHGQDGGHA
ncbi:2Fe-2S iron-sulfur cluster-binding protein [Streptomyces sp. NPDC057336]|uniref:2Fe-2S iron-sulfur cluster-binding protein n=1 Tax=Streptomyces sp. NPDC057336 TaxID=3346102 RepID=UPI00363E7D44